MACLNGGRIRSRQTRRGQAYRILLMVSARNFLPSISRNVFTHLLGNKEEMRLPRVRQRLRSLSSTRFSVFIMVKFLYEDI